MAAVSCLAVILNDFGHFCCAFSQQRKVTYAHQYIRKIASRKYRAHQ